MSVAFLIAVYFIVWWVTLFIVLPFGVRTQAEAGSVVAGTPESAPAQFRLGRVLLITTGVAAVIFALLYAGVQLRIIDLYGLSAGTE